VLTAKSLIAWVVALSLLAIAAWVTLSFIGKPRPITVRGAVVRQDTDPSKQIPIANADVIALAGETAVQVTSDQAGLFTIHFPKEVRKGELVTLRITHGDYQPLQLNEIVGDWLYVARMVPLATPVKNQPPKPPEQVVANVRVRYVVRSTNVADVGSEAKTFQVANNGNVPCETQSLCSPDGNWRAATTSIALDAGEGNEFRNIRVSCIAGPCPFTRIAHQTVSADGRHLDIAAVGWSDTTTFLVEAEVVHPADVDVVREAYPAIFGPSFSFSLPSSSEGPSIEAELNGEPIVFPLGPDYSVTFARCTRGELNDRITSYRCELLPGYRFQ
jgi:hypothetical protein